WNVKANHRTLKNPKGVVYKYASYGSILKSSDKGKTWNKITKGLPETLDVGRIIVDPNNSKNIIIATNSGIYRSTNQGDSWEMSATGLPNNSPRDMSSYYNPETKEFVLYVLEQTFYVPDRKTLKGKGGIYKSTDGGQNWISISGNIALDYTKITTYDAVKGYWKTMVFWLGKTEKEIKEQYPDLPTEMYSTFNRLVVNPLNKDEIYISHNVKHDKAFGPGDVWKTNDGGKNWIATARTGKDWSSDKDKDYWQSRNNPLGVNTKFAHLQSEIDHRAEISANRFMQINNKGELFICIEQQILRSNDNGKSWNQVDDNETKPGSNSWVGRGGSNLPGRFMLLDTGIKGRKFFCSGEHGLWENASLDSYPDKNAVAVKQIEGQLNEKGATSIASVAVHPNDPNTIYMIMFRQDHRGALRKSTDGGKTWNDVSQPINAGGNISNNVLQSSLIIDYKTPSTIYFNTIASPISEVGGPKTSFNEHGIFKSTDSGLTWTRINKGLPTVGSTNEAINVRRIVMDPINPNILYAALVQSEDGKTDGGLYMSNNKGETWSKAKIPNEIVAVNNIFIDKNTQEMFISCGRSKGTLEEGGVWKSKNNGKDWEKIFDMPYVWQTETSPLDSKIITVAVASQNENKGVTTLNPGAYLSKDGGKTWTKINKNLGQPDSVIDLKPDPEDESILWCALKGSGWAKAIIK
ncbi:WD40/YVTN/BNR-like repeat-containing protein, partial [Flavobacterium sp.]|uniref:WD40/YVTN/BNR-like repeat-containing protein n=1 Tax=Flavobacterium sp. TaxID=239 RepID=UPI003C545F6A